MAQVNLYVPDQLREQLLAAEDDGADINWSELFQEAARERLAARTECDHRRLRCRDCGAVVDREHP